jgi:hypothetical protein
VTCFEAQSASTMLTKKHGARETYGEPPVPKQPSGGQRGGQRRQIGRGKWNGGAAKPKPVISSASLGISY